MPPEATQATALAEVLGQMPLEHAGIDQGPGVTWPAGVPPRYSYLVARDGPPAPRGLIADIVLDGAGLFLTASAPQLSVRVRLARLRIPDLPEVSMGVTLGPGPVDGGLWDAIVERARAAMPDEVLLALVARDPVEGELFVAAAGAYTLVEPQLDASGLGDWQPQQVSGCSVRATPVADAILEVHSHHRLPAYFSATDDRDETARRIYGVLGRLDTPAPEVALRVATGCTPHAVERVAFEQVFTGGLGAFRDVHFPGPASGQPDPAGPAPSPRPRPRSLVAALLLDIAEDVAAIREHLETRQPPDAERSPFWALQ